MVPPAGFEPAALLAAGAWHPMRLNPYLSKLCADLHDEFVSAVIGTMDSTAHHERGRLAAPVVDHQRSPDRWWRPKQS